MRCRANKTCAKTSKFKQSSRQSRTLNLLESSTFQKRFLATLTVIKEPVAMLSFKASNFFLASDMDDTRLLDALAYNIASFSLPN